MFATVIVFAIIQSVALVALSLIVLGLGLSVLTWWFWRTARPEPVSLAPLEIMSGRRYARASEEKRKHLIDSTRDLVAAAKSSPKPRRRVQLPTHPTQPELSPSKPVDPLLK